MSLILRDIWYRYPRSDRPLLQGVELEVPTGASVAVMAPSGVGKSTLLSIAGLLIKPDRGTVQIDGKDVGPKDGKRLLGDRVSWVLQSVNLLPHRTVLDNTILPSRAHGSSLDSSRATATMLLTQLGLSHRLTSLARTLSGGEAQRAGVARALVTSPSVLIADEPTANLDRDTAQEVATALLSAAQNTSVLLATHDPMIAEMADTVVHLAPARGD
ncbi:ABC transporter ATP-binding protein [Tessaracoccus rhinocerotis]|uniref:ABC transporter ATP-binding protein n=1 Tax=Tessaracoccus rhinocerotis TaxID=1689449 RepID=UPI003CCC6D12